MRDLLKEALVALRILARNKIFTTFAVALLALGIGTSAALFSVIDAMLIHPLPFPTSSRLVNLQAYWKGVASAPLSYLDFRDAVFSNSVFERAAVYHTGSSTLRRGDAVTHARVGFVSSQMFSVLGVTPIIGRDFSADEDLPGKIKDVFPVILSQSLWTNHFAASPQVVGSTIALDGRYFTIIGVMPKGFQFPLPPDDADLWTTIAVDLIPVDSGASLAMQRSAHYFQAIAQLKSGVSLVSAQTKMATIASRLAEVYPDTNRDETIRVIPEADYLLGDRRPQLRLIVIGIICLLLISYINVTTLFMSRAAAQAKDVAVQLAFGAKYYQLIRGILMQCFWLTLFGAAFGLALGVSSLSLLRSQVAFWTPKSFYLSQMLSSDAVIFVCVILLLSPFICGAGLGFTLFMKDQLPLLLGARTSSNELRGHLRDALVVGQISLAVVLLCVSGLLSRSLVRLIHVDLGFVPHQVITFDLQFPTSFYKTEQRSTTLMNVLSEIRSLPGVTSASAIFPLPLSGNTMSADFAMLGQTASKRRPSADLFATSSDYFATIRATMIRGRSIRLQDEQSSSSPVAMINETLAKRYFHDRNPIGEKIQPLFSIGSDVPPQREIIGIVRDINADGAREKTGPQIYIPYTQLPTQSATVVVKAANTGESVINSVRMSMKHVDPNLAFYNIRLLTDYVDLSQESDRMSALVCLLLAMVGLFLATVGLYSVISYRTALRTKEFGICLALGAPKERIISSILWYATKLVIVGTSIGVIAALIVARLISDMLFGVSPFDVPTFITVMVMICVVTIVASYIPANRAVGLDPMTILRSE